MAAESKERVDHMYAARQWLDAADREASTDANAKTPPVPLAEAFAAVAQVHASLALAEQLERLNEALKADPPESPGEHIAEVWRS